VTASSAGATIEALARCTVPTVGHVVEDGFLSPAIRRIAGSGTAVGPAHTLAIRASNAYALNHALVSAGPGEVLVVDMGDDHGHACVGAVTATAAAVAGLAAVIVDGMVTDHEALRELGLPVFARGLAGRTTKYVEDASFALQGAVTCGGVVIRPGDLVMADGDGIVVLDPDTASSIAQTCLDLEHDEPELLDRIRSGTALSDLLRLLDTDLDD
jgi:4-hydroxy-4-methyl-2-oxoglutarate aldolase